MPLIQPHVPDCKPVIYHGTPMTPRAALLDVCAGRAMCVSFFRPDDVEAVEAISPAVMFRQRRVFILESSHAQRAGMGRGSGLDALFRVVGAALVSPGKMGGDPRYAGSAVTAQRRALERLAVRAKGRSTLAHGRAYRAAVAAVREIRPGLLGLDGRGQRHRLPGLSRAYGGSGQGAWQPLACNPHDARHGCGARLSIYQRGQHFTGAERVAI